MIINMLVLKNTSFSPPFLEAKTKENTCDHDSVSVCGMCVVRVRRGVCVWYPCACVVRVCVWCARVCVWCERGVVRVCACVVRVCACVRVVCACVVRVCACGVRVCTCGVRVRSFVRAVSVWVRTFCHST
jgi:hypothetical protein